MYFTLNAQGGHYINYSLYKCQLFFSAPHTIHTCCMMCIMLNNNSVKFQLLFCNNIYQNHKYLLCFVLT